MDNAHQFYFVGTLAEELGVNPREISDLFYRRKLDCNRCPLLKGRRIIPSSYLPEVRKALIEYGSIISEDK